VTPTVNEFLIAYVRASEENPLWRSGQACFNALLEVRPDLAERMRGTDADPFYVQGRVGEALAWIADNWDGADG
jgi:hypothetical protein